MAKGLLTSANYLIDIFVYLQDLQGRLDLVVFKDHLVPQEIWELQDLLVFRVTQVLKDSLDSLEVQGFKDHRGHLDRLAPQVHSCFSVYASVELLMQCCAGFCMPEVS